MPAVAKPSKSKIKTTATPHRPFLRFYHSEKLRAKTLAVLSTMETADDCTKHSSELADIIAELTDDGLEYFFMKPLKLAKVGFLTEQSASLGISASKQVFGSVVRNIIGHMDSPQLLTVCAYMRELMK